MKTSVKIILVMVFILIAGGIMYFTGRESVVVTNPILVPQKDNILGCYVSKLAKDVYTLKIQLQEGENVSGTLVFKNFEKDSSSGSFIGTYTNGILLGYYSFDSEGTHSNMQVIFKKEGQSFVRGYGSIKNEGEKVTFEDLNAITYDANSTFVKSIDCIE